MVARRAGGGSLQRAVERLHAVRDGRRARYDPGMRLLAVLALALPSRR
jgi:hypothetical protein